MSIERAVAILTPIFGAGAAWLTALIGAHFPGVHVDPAQVIALEIAGFTGAVAAALKWLHGRQRFVVLADDAKRALADELTKLRAEIGANPAAGVAIADIEQVIDSHVPKAVAQALQELLSSLAVAQPIITAAPPVSTPEAPTAS